MFDLERDPEEMRSVYGDPQYATVRRDLEARLRELRRQYAVPERDTVPHRPFEAPPGMRRAEAHRH